VDDPALQFHIIGCCIWLLLTPVAFISAVVWGYNRDDIFDRYVIPIMVPFIWMVGTGLDNGYFTSAVVLGRRNYGSHSSPSLSMDVVSDGDL